MVTIHVQNITFPGIEAVLFDKDGTLEDSQVFLRRLGISRSRYIDAQIPGTGEPLLMAFGILEGTLDPAGLMAVGSRWENEIAASAYIAETGRSWYEARDIAHKSFEEADLDSNSTPSPLLPGSRELIEKLAQAGLKIGILSADSTENITTFIKKHQLSEYIDLAIGANETFQKPDPAFFKQACAELGIEPQKTLMVGDSQGDIEMAKAGGAAGTIGIGGHLSMANIAITNLQDIKVSNA